MQRLHSISMPPLLRATWLLLALASCASSPSGGAPILGAAGAAAVAGAAEEEPLPRDAAEAAAAAAAASSRRAARSTARARGLELFAQAEAQRAARAQARRLGAGSGTAPSSPQAGAHALVELYSEAAQLGVGPGSAAAAATLARMYEWGWDGVGDLVRYRPTSVLLSASRTSDEDSLLLSPHVLGARLAPFIESSLARAADAFEGAAGWLARQWGSGDEGQAARRSHSSSLVVPVDMAAAVRWYSKAASLGNASAQFTMGVLHRHGLFGVPADEALGMLYLYWAATGGSSEAALALGHHHATGEGVPNSCASAVAYLVQPALARAKAVAESSGLLQAVPQVRGTGDGEE